MLLLLIEYLKVKSLVISTMTDVYFEGGELFERISSKEYRLTEDKCRMFTQQVKTMTRERHLFMFVIVLMMQDVHAKKNLGYINSIPVITCYCV